MWDEIAAAAAAESSLWAEALLPRERQAREAVLQNRQALEQPYHAAWAGAADGDVVMVQFFDYACPYCHQINGDVERLLREDSRLKVVWREYPVLGPNSESAAIASMAAAEQGRWRQFHAGMFALGRPTEAALQRTLGFLRERLM